VAGVAAAVAQAGHDQLLGSCAAVRFLPLASASAALAS